MPYFLPLPPRPSLAMALQRLPQLAGGVSRITPFSLQRHCILLVMKQVLHELLREGELDFLAGRQFQIWVSDADVRLTFGLQRGQLTLSQSHQHADTVIRGKLFDFLSLASRQEDPDTLFFQRRLVIEGDTDLGHEMKNVLDTLDLDAMPTYFTKGLNWLVNTAND